VIKVLVVEDDADLVETYTDLLTAHNYAVTSVSKASDAIAVVTKLLPDIILLDMNLPDNSGTVVISLARQYKRLAHTKIIVVTGYPEILQKRNYISLRVDLILRKPVQNDTLLQKMSELLTPAVI